MFHGYNSVDEIIPGKLYLGNLFGAENKTLLKSKGVTHVLIVANDLMKCFPEEFVYEQIEIDDDGRENILQHFPKCLEFINRGIQTGAVYVHCAAGVSRSPTIVIAHLMTTEGLDYYAAYGKVKKCRPAIYPNDGFVLQLKLYHEMGCKVDSDHPKYQKLLKGTLNRERTLAAKIFQIGWH